MTLEEALDAAARASHTELEPRVRALCAAHYALLVRWNTTHNLTRVLEPSDAARRHYLDCLVPLRDIAPAASVSDLGSGAGFPGLLAAMVWPTTPITLVEPARKRASFLRVVAAELGLRHVTVEEARAEEAAPADLVLSRATFSDRVTLGVVDRIKPGGRLALWCGPGVDDARWAAEVASWGGRCAQRVPYLVNGLAVRTVLLAERPES